MDERQRLVKIMESEQVNAKEFSSQVGISASTLSNILGGRNKPSLEVMQAILNVYRTISADWLILGVGAMYRSNADAVQMPLFDIPPQNEKTAPEQIKQPEVTTKMTERTVKKVMIFYSDGTFEER
jgi:transcriptional regulator with XRE-family HTH domain